MISHLIVPTANSSGGVTRRVLTVPETVKYTVIENTEEELKEMINLKVLQNDAIYKVKDSYGPYNYFQKDPNADCKLIQLTKSPDFTMINSGDEFDFVTLNKIFENLKYFYPMGSFKHIRGKYTDDRCKEERTFKVQNKEYTLKPSLPTVSLTSNKLKKPLSKLAPEVTEVVKNHCPHFILPYQIKEDTLICIDYGPDLIDVLRSRRKIQLSAFKNLAKELDFLHKNGFIHRDIKPENMFEKDGTIYLGDLDTMAQISKVTQLTPGTIDYYPCQLFIIHSDVNKISNWQQDPKLAIKQDQYAFLASLILAYNYKYLCDRKGTFFPKYKETIDNFTSKYIKPEYQQKVNAFLQDPIHNDLKDLSSYIKFD